MTTTETATAWVPVPLRWRMVQVGDVIVGHGNVLYPVLASHSQGQAWRIQIHVVGNGVVGDPDATVHVLVSVDERDALTVARDQLGARITERRAG